MLPRRLFDSAQLPNASGTTQYTSTSCRTIVTSLAVANPSGTAYTVTVHIIKSGGSASASNTLIYQRTILPGQTVELLDKNKHMEDADFIQAFASTASVVTLHGSGYQVPLGA